MEKKHKKNDWQGRFVSDALVGLVSENEHRLSPSAAAKILHGSEYSGDYAGKEKYSGMFPHINVGPITEYIKQMTDAGIFSQQEIGRGRARRVVIGTASEAGNIGNFRTGQMHKGIEDLTEYGMHALIQKKGSISCFSISDALAVTDAVLGMPGLYDTHRKEIDLFFEDSPETVRSHLLNLYGIERSAVGKKMIGCLLWKKKEQENAEDRI